MIRFSNIPPAANPSSDTVQAFDDYFVDPIELDATVLAAVTGFFTNKGFGEVSSEYIAVTIVTQSMQDGYNPMQLLDTLRGLASVELSGLVAEILNYNRFKSSSLGFATAFKPNEQVQRNIIA